MNIAVIGTGSIVENYATRYALAGHEVFLAWKDDNNAVISPFLETFNNIHLCSIEDAADAADLIIIASSPKDVREVAYWLGDVRRKVILDATANLFTDPDEQIKTIAAIKAITGSQHIIKVFSTRGYEQLLKPLFKDEKVRLVLVGDSRKAKEVTKILTLDLGVAHFFDFGGDDAIPLFNEMTKSWTQLLQKTATQNRGMVAVKK